MHCLGLLVTCTVGPTLSLRMHLFISPENVTNSSRKRETWFNFVSFCGQLAVSSGLFCLACALCFGGLSFLASRNVCVCICGWLADRIIDGTAVQRRL